jgi:hypothetical protein
LVIAWEEGYKIFTELVHDMYFSLYFLFLFMPFCPTCSLEYTGLAVNTDCSKCRAILANPKISDIEKRIILVNSILRLSLGGVTYSLLRRTHLLVLIAVHIMLC